MNSSVNSTIADSRTLKVARWRFYSVALVMTAATLALIWHVASLQVLPDTDKGFEFLQNQGQSRTLRTEPITAYRGVITDRNGEPLAVSTPVASLWANPKVLLQAPQHWAELSQALGWNKAELESRLARYSSREFMYLQRHLPPQAAETILALDIPGVYSQTEYRRYYPAGDVTAHLVGMTDIDDRGQEGMELAYDAWLSGENGAKEVLKDLHGRTVKELQLIKSARSGQSLTLSIDLRLQYLAHRELKNAVEESGARAGSLVILDVVTGEVLAMANQPSYNPNDRSHAKGAALRNRAITDVYEPGSTMKPLAVMAALESGKFKPNDVINTSPGYIQVGSKTLKDLHDYGTLDLSMVIAKSSQVGMTKLALELEPHIIRDMYARLGIGQTTGTGFPGEGSGLLPAHARWRPIQRATLAYGYGMNVTVLQLAQAYSVIASGGLKRPVSLLRVDSEAAGERVVAEHYTQDIVTMLKRAATEGTATRARAISYTVAGKTGTVHKVGAHGYEEKRYMSSFAGMAPADNPRIVAVVVIDEPDASKYFGGLVAAPVFSKVAEGALRMMQIPPQPLVPPKLASPKIMSPNMAVQPKKEERKPHGRPVT
ncbi:penicillin-binding protein 2 [Cellvibrio sp. PSBB006]|uniref:peptidoglycan D,D-transpeptidase FtsI family protein n=1 Tax=Cellvibrio sp. PSBB006 TaxID=1987723 RepID=UPI000B3B867E|nr:penicillin-binding transpeptidase domain-containing protein [Cellvibrio sp. PSBB006]ARU27440.1 cell division protein [Cellvibrio sp. PSBB006]